MPRPLADSEYIFGLHDPGGEGVMADRGKRGWLVFSVPIGSDPNDHKSFDYSHWYDQGYGLIVRLNNGYEPGGTIPFENDYPKFAQRCANFVAASRGVHIWVIGNEPNHATERPGVVIDHNANPPRIVNPGEVITPERYARAYKLCRAAIRALPGHENDQVVASAPAPWNIETTYPGNESGDWIRYFADLLRQLRGPDQCDGIALHTYTHGADPQLVYSDEKMNHPQYSQYHWHFRVYQDYLAVVPPNMRHLPIYITESNQGDAAWLDVNAGWVQRAYGEIDWWNRDPTHQQIRALCLYRWTLADRWGIQNKGAVLDDFRAAMQYSYKWRALDPVPPYRVEWLAHQTPARIPGGSRLTIQLGLRNTGFNHWPPDGSKPVTLSYRWFTPDGQKVELPPEHQVRTPLPREILSGDSVTLRAQLVAPGTEGDYVLRWDMMEQGTGWFASQGNTPLEVNVSVTKASEYLHPETGITIAGPFLEFYRQYSEAVVGAPLSTQQADRATGFQTQYFRNLALEEFESGRVRPKAAGEAMYGWAARMAQLEAEVERLRQLTNADLQPPPMQDIIHTLPRDAAGFVQRALTDVRRIVIGHTGTDPGVTVDRIAEADRQSGWPGIAYHFFLDGDGNIVQTQPLAEAINQESWIRESVTIGVAGNFDAAIPGESQLQNLSRLCAWLLQQTGLAKADIVGASEVTDTLSPGRQWLQEERWKDALANRVQALLDTAPGGGAAAVVARREQELREARNALAQAQKEIDQLRKWIEELRKRLSGGPARPQVTDVVQQLPRDASGFAKRTRESIRYVVMNHTAAAPDVPLSEVAAWHRQNFPGITYQYFIDVQGQIYQTGPLDEVADPERIYLAQGVNIGLAGNFDNAIPTDAQMESAAQLCAWLIYDLVLPLSSLVGVAELVPEHTSPGQQWLTGQRWKQKLTARVQTLLNQANSQGSEVDALRRQVAELKEQLAAAERLILQLRAEIERLSQERQMAPKPTLHDVVDTLPKHPTLRYETRHLYDVTHIAIHHSAAPGNLTPEVIARYHVNPDPSRNKDAWPGIGYHFYIMPDGTTYQTNRLETLSYHIYAANGYSVGICLAGNFMETPPTPEQVRSCAGVVAWLMDVLHVAPHRVLGHKEFPQQSTSCPGTQWLDGARWHDDLLGQVETIRRDLGLEVVGSGE